MNAGVKRAVRGGIIFLEICAILLLCVKVARRVQKQLHSIKYAATLSADRYYPQVKSERFPHFFEPEAGNIINDHPAWLGHNVSYSINADSFNERNDYPISKPAGGLRIMVLGDSFTYGLFVNTYENYTELLEDYLAGKCPDGRQYEVINLGVPAYDVGYSTERFRLRGQKYNPDLVVWFMNPFTFEMDADRRQALEDEYLRKIPEADRWKVLNGKAEYYPGMLAWQQFRKEINTEQQIEKQAQYFREFLASYHGDLLIVANQWDLWHPVAADILQKELIDRGNAWIYKMDPLVQGVTLLPDGHPNAEGHKRISENIATYIIENHLLMCER